MSAYDLLAQVLLQQLPAHRSLVAVDGVDGSGKTTFSTHLGRAVHTATQAAGSTREVVIVHVDDYLNPSAVRHRRGRRSPEGFFFDTYNKRALIRNALEPLGPSGSGLYSTSAFDAATDSVRLSPRRYTSRNAIVIVEGMFLHRVELRGYWHASFFLDVPFEITAARMAQRDGTADDPSHPSMRRYVEGQQLYFATARPWEQATYVIDNSAAEPRLIPPAHLGRGRR